MWPRILIGGFVGGVVVFLVSFVTHGILNLQSRTLINIPDDAGFIGHLKSHDLTHGLYVFPDMPRGADRTPESMREASKRFAAGPHGFLLIAHGGEPSMPEMLLKEFVSNVIAALIAAWIVSLMAIEIGFVRRWFAVFLIGIFAWFSISASYGIWYGFPHDFLHEELLCAALEWGAAGLAIAAIVRPKSPAATLATPKAA
jgi:hypothetical protein